jgi:hypothetical protein
MKSKIEFYLDGNVKEIEPELKYILKIWSLNYGIELYYASTKNNNAIHISTGPIGDICVLTLPFSEPERFNYILNSDNNGFIINNNEPDYLATAFYLITSAQELNTSSIDKYNRFPYEQSIQFKKSTISKNIVQECFEKLNKKIPQLSSLPNKFFRSKFFISHDIDLINNAIYQDGFFALKNFNLFDLFSICYANIIKHPQWFNMDLIMDIENEFDFKSTFYWLVKKGNSAEGIKNSDYDIGSKKIINAINNIENRGWENGLHKSTFDVSFQSEMNELPRIPKGNRYHFLKFHPHTDFQKIDASGLSFDSSLGFAEEIGFRNNYGQPYQPYDFKNRRAFNFIECPLHMMDTTLHGYQKISANEGYQKLIQFIEQNSDNCVLSLLWHNNYFTNYKYGDYFKLYKKLLAYFYENKFECITQSEIISKYLINVDSN